MHLSAHPEPSSTKSGNQNSSLPAEQGASCLFSQLIRVSLRHSDVEKIILYCHITASVSHTHDNMDWGRAAFHAGRGAFRLKGYGKRSRRTTAYAAPTLNSHNALPWILKGWQCLRRDELSVAVHLDDDRVGFTHVHSGRQPLHQRKRCVRHWRGCSEQTHHQNRSNKNREKLFHTSLLASMKFVMHA